MDAALYVHIPYCAAKCDYCDFYSIACGSEGVSDEYLSCLVEEAKIKVNEFHVKAWRSVYFGGGTPSLMSARQILHFLPEIVSSAALEKNDIEFTFEVNPETLTVGKLEALKTCGVNRLSLGIQSMNERALNAVHRHCSVEKINQALSIIKQHWTGRLSVDFIAGLPEQSDDEFLQSLEKGIDFNPDHVSLYTLTLEENTPLFERYGDSWDFDSADRQWLLGAELLCKYGYSQYEVSNFSKPGFESRHNSFYWQQESYIGLGAGATSSIYSFNDGGGIRLTNLSSIKKYIDCYSGSKNPDEACTKEILELATEEFEYLMMGFRTLKGVSENTYNERYGGKNLWNSLEDRLMSSACRWHVLMEEGKARVYQCNGDRFFALTQKGLLFLNSFLEQLL